jgi:hypothetical protein
MADCALNGRRPEDKASCWVAPVQLAALPNAPETDMVPTRCGTEGSLQATCWREGLLVAHFVEKLPGASSPIFYLGKRAKSGAAFCMLPRKIGCCGIFNSIGTSRMLAECRLIQRTPDIHGKRGSSPFDPKPTIGIYGSASSRRLKPGDRLAQQRLRGQETSWPPSSRSSQPHISLIRRP